MYCSSRTNRMCKRLDPPCHDFAVQVKAPTPTSNRLCEEHAFIRENDFELRLHGTSACWPNEQNCRASLRFDQARNDSVSYKVLTNRSLVSCFEECAKMRTAKDEVNCAGMYYIIKNNDRWCRVVTRAARDSLLTSTKPTLNNDYSFIYGGAFDTTPTTTATTTATTPLSCPDDEFRVLGSDWLTRWTDSKCVPCTLCKAHEFASVPCGITADTTCRLLSPPCHAFQTEVAPPSATSDRVCELFDYIKALEFTLRLQGMTACRKSGVTSPQRCGAARRFSNAKSGSASLFELTDLRGNRASLRRCLQECLRMQNSTMRCDGLYYNFLDYDSVGMCRGLHSIAPSDEGKLTATYDFSFEFTGTTTTTTTTTATTTTTTTTTDVSCRQACAAGEFLMVHGKDDCTCMDLLYDALSRLVFFSLELQCACGSSI